MLLMTQMKDIDQIRRDNMVTIEQELGGPAKAAQAMGWKTATQWINLRNGAPDSKTKLPRGMRKSTARKIERVGEKPEYWLDIDHSGDAPIAQESRATYETKPPTMQQALEVVLDALAALPEKRKSTVLGAMGGYVPESPNARTTIAFLVGEMDGASLGGDLTTPALSPTVERVIRAKLRTETKDITPEGTRTDAGNHD